VPRLTVVLSAILLITWTTPVYPSNDRPPLIRSFETLRRAEALFEAKQYREVIELLKPLAKGNSLALLRLFESYRRLNDVRGFIELALPLAEQGDVDAQYFVAAAHEDMRPPNQRETLRWYRIAAQGGSALAADALGRIYFTGYVGMDQDDQASKLLFRDISESERCFNLCLQLSQRGAVPGSCLTGLALIEIQRPQRSVERIFRLLSQAEDHKNLFLIHEFGLLAEPDRDKAAEALAKIREHAGRSWNKYFLMDVAEYQKGESAGLRKMGLLLRPRLSAHAVTDARTFVRLLKAAADAADTEANWWIAHLSMNGEHVPRDDVLAYYYANRALALGSPHAKKQLDDLEKRMSRAEIAEAQKMSREWMRTRQ
jgi:TPR repeat protein